MAATKKLDLSAYVTHIKSHINGSQVKIHVKEAMIFLPKLKSQSNKNQGRSSTATSNSRSAEAATTAMKRT